MQIRVIGSCSNRIRKIGFKPRAGRRVWDTVEREETRAGAKIDQRRDINSSVDNFKQGAGVVVVCVPPEFAC